MFRSNHFFYYSIKKRMIYWLKISRFINFQSSLFQIKFSQLITFHFNTHHFLSFDKILIFKKKKKKNYRVKREILLIN